LLHQNPPGRPSFSPAEIDDALRVLPSHGWIAGWIGRRDRALLVLSQMAGLSYENIAELTVADIAVSEGTATIRTPGGTTILHRNDDDLICGPCALARWLHALDLTALYPSGAVVAAVIARAAPLTAQSPHLCEGTVAVMPTTRAVPVLPRTDQCGVRTRPSRSAPTPLIPEQGTNSRPPTVAGLTRHQLKATNCRRLVRFLPVELLPRD